MIALRNDRFPLLGILTGALIFGIDRFFKAHRLEALAQDRLATNLFYRTLYPQLPETCKPLLYKKRAFALEYSQCIAMPDKKARRTDRHISKSGSEIVSDLKNYSDSFVYAQLLKIASAACITLTSMGAYLAWRLFFR